MSVKALMQVWWVGLGGFLGANARYWLGGWLTRLLGAQFPWATLVINVSGCFLLGLLGTWFNERLPVAPATRLLWTIGFLGAYTTFSTYEYESLALIEAGSLPRCLANLAGSVVVGFAAAWLGVRLARYVL